MYENVDNGQLKEKLIKDFPGLSKEIDGQQVYYLDSAATTLKPRQMVEAINDYYLGVSANIHRGKHFALEEVSNQYEGVRYKVANLIDCSGNEVVFLRNTTEAINLVASGLNLSKTDRVVCMAESHHSNMLPWLQAASVDYIRVTDDFCVDLEHYQSLLASKPKVVALTHCSNVTGIYIDLPLMVKMAKAAGALVVVDAAQSVPHRKLSVSELDIDFLAFSAHKMLGPTGVGVLYGKSQLLEKLTPLNLGGGVVDWVEFDAFTLRKVPHRFEAGTPNISGVLGLGASIDYLNGLGFDFIREHDKRLGRFMLEQAGKRDYLQVLNSDPDADRGAVLSFTIPKSPNLDDVARYLSDSFGIMCRNGHLCAQPYISSVSPGQVLRVSGYVYTFESDIEHFFDSLDQIVSFL
ncbi:aminotransferase class V-fold PLP-dependent enzyme [Thalassomonas viridans]|uniref:cysteine desulfurase n=1 Tax=Thalassomonas viridans TaxID=137584 RepID=A0AAE9ZBN6_9GAMM|nr:aminotransferase class V-fold PLP-dependent enzyme [Thalassomonas viridans]WDE09185.1 aminotransferase class V-fold PLP-dependent enzyme [Thalassomonas viridans]